MSDYGPAKQWFLLDEDGPSITLRYAPRSIRRTSKHSPFYTDLLHTANLGLITDDEIGQLVLLGFYLLAAEKTSA